MDGISGNTGFVVDFINFTHPFSAACLSFVSVQCICCYFK